MCYNRHIGLGQEAVNPKRHVYEPYRFDMRDDASIVPYKWGRAVYSKRYVCLIETVGVHNVRPRT